MFLGKGVLKICSKFTGEHPCRSVISAWVFSCKLAAWNYKTNWKMIWNLVPCLNCRLHVFFINNQNFEIRLTLFSKSIKIAPKNCLLIVNFQSLIFGHLFSMLQPLSQWNVLFINSITCSLNVVLWYYVKFYVILPNLFYFQSQIAPINCLLVSIIAPFVYFQKFLQKNCRRLRLISQAIWKSFTGVFDFKKG